MGGGGCIDLSTYLSIDVSDRKSDKAQWVGGKSYRWQEDLKVMENRSRGSGSIGIEMDEGSERSFWVKSEEMGYGV